MCYETRSLSAYLLCSRFLRNAGSGVGYHSSQALLPLCSSEDKMVVKDNCPVFDAWIVVNEQAVPT
jgi:hypothetical protein